jgi:tRNA dimethylallyltransferase
VKVVVVSGPTASGKTDLAVDLALSFGGEVVNFDSLLFYREINIGTAKPSLEEQRSVPHHLINVRSIASPMNAADFARTALPLVEGILASGVPVYLVGGSGFYLQALLKGMYDSPTTPEDIIRRSDELYLTSGIVPFLEILQQHDHISYQRYHENDHYRIRRAVEHWWTTGQTLSQARERKDQSNEELQRPTIHDWDLLHVHLDIPKEEHRLIIQERTDRMLEKGLMSEVRELLASGFTGKEKPLQSIGYKEALEYINGNYETLDACRERINISTRQLAKSQRTWFKRDQSKQTFHPREGRAELFLRVERFLLGTKGPE